MTIGFTLESVKAFEAGLCSEERVRADFICLLDTLKQMDVRYLDISTRELTIIGEDEAAAEMEKRGLRVGCLIFFDQDSMVNGAVRSKTAVWGAVVFIQIRQVI